MSYDDDYFHPNNDILVSDNYISHTDDFSVVSDSITLNSETNKKRKIMDDYKKLDKNYHKIYRIFNNKRKEIELYTSPMSCGLPIRDAITGSRYPNYKVGSKYEDLFFKTRLATGEFGDDQGCLFFDTPEQFERHMKIILSQDIKEKWQQKYIDSKTELFRAKN
jgi:hypothetical protein